MLFRSKQLDDDRDFIRTSNFGGEFMDDELQQRVRNIAKYRSEERRVGKECRSRGSPDH